MWWTFHLLISIILSGIYFIFTGNVFESALVFSSSFFIDIDHYFLYLIAERKGFFETYKRFRKIRNKEIPDSDEDKYVLPLHNFEMILALTFLSTIYPIFIPIALGAGIHFIIDVIYVKKFRIKHYYSLTYYLLSKLG